MSIPSVENVPISALRPYSRNARTHSRKQLRQIAASIQRFGFTNPVLISDDSEILCGHGRVEAAKLLNFERVPTLRLSHLNEAERRAYIVADQASSSSSSSGSRSRNGCKQHSASQTMRIS
jgi:ParB-like chromosome segregation protein Spo0J